MNMKLLRGLIDAGLTNEEIEKVLEAVGDIPVLPTEHVQNPAPVESPDEQQNPDNGQIPQQLQEKPNNAEESVNKLKDVLDNSFNEFIEKFQKVNILNSQQPKQETANDILASIINPPQRNN